MQKKINFNEKIFIAGSSGMVGQAIKRTLIKSGYGLDSNGGELLTPNRQELDLLDSVKVKHWFCLNKPTIVILAAARVGGILANLESPTEFILENIKIQNNIIENSWKFGVKRLLFLGSSCIYPKYATQPIIEESLLTGALEETNQWYAIAKISGIKLCEALRKQYNFDAISVMPTNLYGPHDNYHPRDSHVMAALIKKFCDAKKDLLTSVTFWGSGEPFREFMHVDDLASAIIFLLEYWDPNSKYAPLDNKGNPLYILNIGTGEDISLKQLAYKISNLVGYEGEILWDKTKPDGTPRKKLEIRKIKSFGWKPKISLEEGIINTIKNYKEEYYKK
tara:strand:- start:702 stop:1706 length:1005 start_codon:yes stop_codon:yes gene_type:complete